MKKFKVGILGATGMVGQKLITLLNNHPWFKVAAVAASKNSTGKNYSDAVEGRWMMSKKIPNDISSLVIQSVEDYPNIVPTVDFVFSALNMDKKEIKKLEEMYAAHDTPVISNNSAHRWTEDVPMIIPEANASHLDIIPQQQKNRGWQKGFIVVKPNCSIQSYVMILTALQRFIPEKVHVVSLQAISGAGKNFKTWPEMTDNVIPFIDGEEEKSEKEPLKIWGEVNNNSIELSDQPHISATCIRVPVSNGHMASVSVNFKNELSKDKILNAIQDFNVNNDIAKLKMPSAPAPVINYLTEDNAPQTKFHRDYGNGMGISMGRLQKGKHFDWQFISLSHNTVRGAAGGAILTAELLIKKGLIS